MRPLPAALAISLTFSACSGPDSDLPAAYRQIEVPEARLRESAAIGRGEALYEANCALCHGHRGDGRGRRSSGLSSKPTRFADPRWRGSTTARRVFFSIREGRPGTPMPSWDVFSESETWDVVAYVLSLAASPRPGEASPRPVTP